MFNVGNDVGISLDEYEREQRVQDAGELLVQLNDQHLHLITKIMKSLLESSKCQNKK